MEYQPRLPPPSPVKVVPSSLAEVQAAIARIRALDLHNATVDEIKEMLFQLLKGYNVVAPFLPAGLSLHRLRLFPSEKPANLSQIGAPLAHLIQKNQRCNRSGESLFYCSTARSATFFELHVQAGEKAVLSTWRTTRQFIVNKVGYTHGAFSTLGSTRDCPTWKAGPNPRAETEANRSVDQFLADAFTADVWPGEEDRYKLTIAVSEKLLHGANFSFDGLLYPTIPMQGNADNIALTPTFVSSGLEFVRAEFLQVTRIEGKSMTFDTLDTATARAEDGSILWKGHADKWTLKQGDQIALSFQDGRWIARDSSGRVVEPD